MVSAKLKGHYYCWDSYYLLELVHIVVSQASPSSK